MIYGMREKGTLELDFRGDGAPRRRKCYENVTKMLGRRFGHA